MIRTTRRAVLRAGLALPAALGLRRLLAPAAAPAAVPPADEELEAEVCVIGAGPAGALLAEALARRGVRTLLVESGPPLGAARDPRLAGLDAYEVVGPLAYPLAASRFRGCGGTSNLWTGTCPRLRPDDFAPHGCTPPDAPWPIAYADLEPYYEAAEAALRVRGVDGLAAAPPRRAPFPRPLRWEVPNLRRLAGRAAVALPLQPLPYSDDRGRPVNVAARQVAAFAAAPHAALLTGHTVRRLQCDGDRVDGVLVQALGGPPRRLRGRCYVVACGGVESARLLLLSRAAGWPDGLGNRDDLVGRFFMEHPVVAIGRGTVPGNWNRWSAHERAASEQVVADARRRGLGAVRLRLVARPAPWAWRRPVAALRGLELEVRAEIEMTPDAANRVTLSAARHDAFGDPGACLALRFGAADQRTIAFAIAAVRRLLAACDATDVTIEPRRPPIWMHHHLGTCRMGDDPRTSVVDRHLRVHGLDNLYVAGSAPFVTAGVSNPTLTIAALSLRLADRLVARLRG